MDPPGVIRRAPDLALIDEIAHTNAPELEHEKRYEDVQDMLAAGIDVFSTVNVQHLESLNDQVAELTGIRRETIPDQVLGPCRRGGPGGPHPRGAAAGCATARRTRGSGSRRRCRTSSRSRTCRRCARSRCGRAPRRSSQASGCPGGRGHPEDRLAHRRSTGGPRAAAGAGATHPAWAALVRRAWRSAKRLGGELDLL